MSQWIAWGVAALATVVALVSLAGSRRKTSNLRLLLEALENSDTSVRFSRNRSVNRTLNRIAEIIAGFRRRAEQADLYYGLILDKAEAGIIVVDSRGFVTVCNAAALRLLGLAVLTHLSQLSRIDPSLPEAMAAAEPGRRMTVGTGLGLTLQVASLKTDGRVLRIFSIIDISHELEACEADAWEQLTRTLAHEIMNSLAPVISLSDTLLYLPQECEDERREGLEAIGRTGRSLMEFVESYRKFTNSALPRLQAVNVGAMLKDLSSLFPQITWQCRSGMAVTADESMLMQILVNICTNAMQAGARRISVKAADGVIDISNDGEPLPAGIAGEIFTPFFSTRADGSGIGLSVSRRMMTGFGGALSLVSADPVTFRLAFR
ncbi:MAG: PAS domain-containing protein [Muribaculaceae bacterium]|nr:PAS domain-containing protein [Muribaculaceae bacterium]